MINKKKKITFEFEDVNGNVVIKTKVSGDVNDRHILALQEHIRDTIRKATKNGKDRRK